MATHTKNNIYMVKNSFMNNSTIEDVDCCENPFANNDASYTFYGCTNLKRVSGLNENIVNNEMNNNIEINNLNDLRIEDFKSSPFFCVTQQRPFAPKVLTNSTSASKSFLENLSAKPFALIARTLPPFSSAFLNTANSLAFTALEIS